MFRVWKGGVHPLRPARIEHPGSWPAPSRRLFTNCPLDCTPREKPRPVRELFQAIDARRGSATDRGARAYLPLRIERLRRFDAATS